jgi:hypothetical protein
MIDQLTQSKPPADAAPRWFHIAVAASMLLSAGSALVGAMRNSATMEAMLQQNTRLVQASATPVLEFSSGNVDEKSNQPALNFNVSNGGSGPARIVWFELLLDGAATKGFSDVAKKLSPPDLAKPIRNVITSTPAPRLLPAGKELLLFSWPLPAPGDARSQWAAFDKERQLGRITARACYCSVLDTCWVSKMDGDLPKQVASCEAGGRPLVH